MARKRLMKLNAIMTALDIRTSINNGLAGFTPDMLLVVDDFVKSLRRRMVEPNKARLWDPETGEYLYETNPKTGKRYRIQVKEKRAQFQLGYKGYVQLALRSGYYKRLNVMSIKPGELIRYDPLTEEIDVHLMEDELARERAQSIGYVAMFEYHNGFKKVLYWSRQKMEAHALRYSKGYAAKSGYTFWEKDFDAMAYKTMLRQLISKWGIMSIEMQRAFENDMGAIDEDGKVHYIDNEQDPKEDTLNDRGVFYTEKISA